MAELLKDVLEAAARRGITQLGAALPRDRIEFEGCRAGQTAVLHAALGLQNVNHGLL
jgi:hypothetical protein